MSESEFLFFCHPVARETRDTGSGFLKVDVHSGVMQIPHRFRLLDDKGGNATCCWITR
jgi:hypothetical protein